MAEPSERPVDAKGLERFSAAIFKRLGVPDDEATQLAEIIVLSDLHGMHSHGVMRIPQYGPKIAAGGFRPGREGVILRETDSTLLLDAEHGIGQTMAVKAMRAAMAKAGKTGVGICGVTNSNHYGAGAYYGLMAARMDMIGILTTNASPSMPAPGGRTMLTGPLPLTVVAPRKTGWPFCLDTAMGVVSKGKIAYAAEKGEKIPLGWGVDKNGTPTDDPQQVLDGGWPLPIGGYKGFGLTCVLEILAGVLTGGALNDAIGNLFTAPAEVPQGLGHFVMAIDVSAFMPADQFKERLDTYITMFKASELQPGIDEVTFPGEPEFRREVERRANGIPLSTNLIARLNAYARDVGAAESI